MAVNNDTDVKGESDEMIFVFIPTNTKRSILPMEK
jgi:hypothetical protein